MFALVCSAILVIMTAGRGGQAIHAKNYKCIETPLTSWKVSEAMATCTESVKANIIEEAFTIIRYQWDHVEHEHDHQLQPHQSQQISTHHHQQYLQQISHQPQHFARPPPGLGTDLLRHVHQIHRLPGQLHQHQAAYPPLTGAAGLLAGIDPRHPHHHHHHHNHHHQRPAIAAAGSSEQPALDANSYFEYQHFDPDVNMRRRSDDGNVDDIDGSGGDRQRRSTSWSIGKTTEISMQERRIAGCLLHCVFSKNRAVDGMGWPTLDGLVSFFSEGVHDHGYFVGTLRAVNLCLDALSHTYNVKRWRSPEHGQSCDLSFDVFNCISDKIGDYCENRPN